jgi:hypothetical protein
MASCTTLSRWLLEWKGIWKETVVPYNSKERRASDMSISTYQPTILIQDSRYIYRDSHQIAAEYTLSLAATLCCTAKRVSIYIACAHLHCFHEKGTLRLTEACLRVRNWSVWVGQHIGPQTCLFYVSELRNNDITANQWLMNNAKQAGQFPLLQIIHFCVILTKTYMDPVSKTGYYYSSSLRFFLSPSNNISGQ